MFGIVNCKAQISSLKRKEIYYYFRRNYLNAEVEYVDAHRLAAQYSSPPRNETTSSQLWKNIFQTSSQKEKLER